MERFVLLNPGAIVQGVRGLTSMPVTKAEITDVRDERRLSRHGGRFGHSQCLKASLLALRIEDFHRNQ